MFLSLRWRAFAWGALIALVASHGTTAQRECAHPATETAIGAAVRDRMGDEARVTLGECHLRGLDGRAAVFSNSSPPGPLPSGTSEGRGRVSGLRLASIGSAQADDRSAAHTWSAASKRLVAVPDAGARTGGFVRFVIFDGAAADAQDRATTHAMATAAGALGRRVGSVDVELHVSAPHARARRGLAPRSVLLREDLEEMIADIGRMPLAPLPTRQAVVGARVVRPIPMGRPIVPSMIAVAPLVRSGDEVRTIVRVGALEARGRAIAAQTGTLGDEIRVVNADSRRSLKARVVGAGEVEVIHE